MVTIDSDLVVRDRTNSNFGFIFYGDAKKAGIRTGTEFEDEMSGQIFIATEYTRYRSDINRPFSGFRCELLKKKSEV